MSVSETLVRVRDGLCEPIPPSEFEAWSRLTGNIIYINEYNILRQMDVAYCKQMNIELELYRIREKERAESNR